MDNLTQKYRNRISHAAIAWMNRKTGGNLLIVNLPDGKMETVEITTNFITQLLLRFEGLTRGEEGRIDGDKLIKYAYQNAIEINKDTEYLTESGKLIIDDLLAEVVEYVREKHASGGGH